ncbi:MULTISPECIES: hypothetical protein [Rhodococcus]|nr:MULTISPECIES: hypothetical protein [Rhodococcus]MDV7242477.1 hypothetical protein [Rhodococcus oxybenzonivorans]MDV7277224.1 hypothetical protein [Rhodococcus oxybenzonivorans]MDV7331966.1 hypothetical protein [Rhodococcus oxybenzonivorans]MDV7344186.1 hypothetical protein [Rhodococcus oxybenzonivorans]MDV8027305.1 hypothetical protein [Rhodococcus sp. IEGM 27]
MSSPTARSTGERVVVQQTAGRHPADAPVGEDFPISTGIVYDGW